MSERGNHASRYSHCVFRYIGLEMRNSGKGNPSRGPKQGQSGSLSHRSAAAQLRAAGAQLRERKWILVRLSFVSDFIGLYKERILSHCPWIRPCRGKISITKRKRIKHQAMSMDLWKIYLLKGRRTKYLGKSCLEIGCGLEQDYLH